MNSKIHSVVERPSARYLFAVTVIAAALLLRIFLVRTTGLDLPPFITFYPAVMLAAFVGGFWPGLLATILAALAVDLTIPPPAGQPHPSSLSAHLALAVFVLMGLLISLLADRYRRSLRSISLYQAEKSLRLREDQLRISEELYRGLFNSMDEGFCIFEVLFDPAGKPSDLRFLVVNAAFERQTGLTEPIGKRIRELAPSLEQIWFDTYGRVALTGEPAHIMNPAAPLGRTYEARAYRVGLPAQRHVAVVFTDITERIAAEQHIRRLNRVYAVLSDINQAIVREKDQHTLLQAACRIAVEQGQFLMAWVGMVHPETQVLHPIASCGKTGDYLDRIFLDFQNPSHAAGPSIQCFLTGRHVISNDIQNDPNLAPWRDDTLRMGFRSFASFPLRVDGRPIGIFNLYIGETDFFLGDELALLDEMAMDISFALEVNRHEKQRRDADQHVLHLNRVYAVLSGINETIVRVKDQQEMLQAACRIAVEKGQFRMAWIGMVDPASNSLKPAASAGLVEDYLDRIRIDLTASSPDSGPAARCLHTGRHAICNDIEHELLRPWKNDALRYGYRSVASFPLQNDGRIAGVFNLYAAELGFFDNDETRLLDEMAMDISYALEVSVHEAERRKTEEELRWRTAFFEAQIDSAFDGVLVVDNHGKVILQNQRMRDLFHIPPEIASDPDDARQLHSVLERIKNPDSFLEKIQHLYAHPDQVSRDVVELLDGTVIDRFSAPVRDKSGHDYGRIWTFRDITQARQLEEQFRQSQKMESIGQLTGGIAHDFNNLLTVIQGCSEFLAEEVQQNPRLHKMATMILDAARRGADLTHRMLAFARRQALQPTSVEVNRLLAGMDGFLRRTLSADIEIVMLPAAQDCRALVDLTQLESAILNLCVNARDAMSGGGKLIIETALTTLDAAYAELYHDVPPGDYVLITVSDTGCGIPPENLARVFDPFFTTKEVGKGTGLGLSMVYGFVKQSQGHIRIYSEPGQGTSVKLYLPVAGQQSQAAPAAETPLADLHGTEVVLLVEDNAPVRDYAQVQLALLGYTVLDAENGQQALQVIRDHPEIDLLFTDLVMPGGLNGHQLALQAAELRPNLKVLYTSGYAEQAVLHQGLLTRGVHLLNKPYTRRELALKLRVALSDSHPSAPQSKG
jgi:signal transduction histidine kinase/GAF domain-containing protein